MGYRGDDLDLRTPQGAAGDIAASQAQVPEFVTAPARARVSGTAGRGTIWVDETALACCNHAYDVAAAHRAIEVRLEHLIYALTRIDDAAEAFEVRGVRVSALRREAATVIATEIPAATGNGKTSPRRAEALEDVLRVAAAHAYRRQAPVSVGDIVYALLDAGIEHPHLLRLLPVAPRAVMAPPEAALDVEAVRERVRNGPAAPQAARSGLADLASFSAVQAGIQSTRIDALEQSIRTLTTELANERKILSGVLQDLQREVMAQREDTSRLGGVTHDKIQAILGDRLQSLEQTFLASRPVSGAELSTLQDRLMTLERALQAEIALTRTAVEALATRPGADLGPVLSRLEAVEDAIAAEHERSTKGEQVLATAIHAVGTTLAGQPEDIATRISEPLNERLDLLSESHETRQTALAEGLAEAHRRLLALEEAVASETTRAGEAASAATEERNALGERIALLSTAVDNAAATSRASYTRMTDTLVQDLSELHDGLSKTHANHQTLASALDTQADDLAKAFALLIGRIDALEKAAARPVEMLQGLSLTVERMHKLTVERYYRRNRFWYWLFGTDDWLAASWPSQSARIEEELRSIKH